MAQVFDVAGLTLAKKQVEFEELFFCCLSRSVALYNKHAHE